MEARLRFRRSARLTHAREFQAVHAGRVFRRAGPLTVHALPGQAAGSRLGLSVGRRVGPAHARVLIKRRLRESFRMLQHTLPRLGDNGYDIIVSVRPHAPLGQAEYQQLLLEGLQECHKAWVRRSAPEQERIQHG